MISVRTLAPLVLLCVLVSPIRASAGLADVIWEMSGPQLIGFGAECHLGGTRDLRCFALDSIRLVGPKKGYPDYFTPKNLWVTVETRLYSSTGKNSDGTPIDAGSVRMFGVDPMFVLGDIHSSESVRVSTAIGFSSNWFFGNAVPTAFNNWAYKIRPFAVEFDMGGFAKMDRLGISYNLRMYPNGFDMNQPPGGLESREKMEAVHGVLVELKF